jgi:hypothetical protein
VQGKAATDTEAVGSPSIVDDVLQSPGQPLDGVTHAFVEERFGYDFGRVRVHADAQASESTRAVNAHAYTVGEHVVFDAGRYSPNSIEGRKLLAHELTHVVQQSSGRGHLIQRQDAVPARIDVALVFGDEETAMNEAKGYAATVIRVISCEDAKKRLLGLGKPLGRVYMVSHGNKEGKIEIDSPGAKLMVKVSDCGKELKGLPGNIAPTDVDFRGCQLGQAPQELESFRKDVGAKSARSGNCWTLVKTMQPFMYGGVPLTKESQIKEGDEAAVNAALRTQLNNLKSEDGRPLKNCIEGLARGETADANFAKLKKLYFAHNGNLTAAWASPEYNFKWQSGSLCNKDLTPDTKPCSSVVAEEPAPAKKQSETATP